MIINKNNNRQNNISNNQMNSPVWLRVARNEHRVVLNDDDRLVFRNIDIANNKVLIQETITEETYEVPIKLIN